MKQTTTNHGWVITGVNPLTELREVISSAMLWDVAVSKAANCRTHKNVQVQRYNPQEITKQGVIKQQSLTFGDNHRLEISEEGVIYCSRCDGCPVPPQKQ